MKKLSFFALAIAGMLFTACSDKDIAAGGPDQEVGLSEGYMALNINLPTTPIVRAGNDNFDDGETHEYKVNDCALLLFHGSAPAGSGKVVEDDLKLLSAQQIMLPSADDDIDNDFITTTYQATAKVNGFTNDGTEVLYALALLNYKNVMSVKDNLPVFKDIVVENPTATSNPGAVAKGDTWAKIRGMITTADLTTRGGTQDYFLMTNAVLSTDKGGPGANISAPSKDNVFQLAEMDRSLIKESEAEAKEAPAGEIFVERAVAKATLTLGGNLQTAMSGDGYIIDNKSELVIAKVEWTLDNRESSSYVARNLGSDPAYISYSSDYFTNKYYRFVGNVAASASEVTAKDYYRTYWCVDPHYSVDVKATDMHPYWVEENGNKVLKNALAYTGVTTSAKEYPLYCKENTFDVEHQSYRNTTRAIIKVTLKDTQTEFYTITGNSELYTETAVQSRILENILNSSTLLDAISKDLNTGMTWQGNTTNFAEYFTITYERTNTGQYAVKSLVVNASAKGNGKMFQSTTPNLDAALETVIENANSQVVAYKYEKGEIYYVYRFKHFAGEREADGSNYTNYVDLAPWNTKGDWENPAPTGGDTDGSYHGKSEWYLGRYGMVRNNWYELEVTDFLKIGLPVDPSGQAGNDDFDEPDTPDDDIVNYLSAKIHVLSWAKRAQKWGF